MYIFSKMIFLSKKQIFFIHHNQTVRNVSCKFLRQEIHLGFKTAVFPKHIAMRNMYTIRFLFQSHDRHSCRRPCQCGIGVNHIIPIHLDDFFQPIYRFQVIGRKRIFCKCHVITVVNQSMICRSLNGNIHYIALVFEIADIRKMKIQDMRYP